MQLTLSAEEADALRELLVTALADLRSEIHHTESSEFRAHLRHREGLLLRVREQLGAHEP